MTKANFQLFLFCILIIVHILSSASLSTAQANILYVDKDVESSGMCSSWEDACATIQEAIDSSETEDEIWVKQGHYNVAVTIDVHTPVLIFGGFSGTETQRDQRNWINNVTILDGQNSGARRITIDSDCTLDGFVITGGDGGGVKIQRYKSSIIRNCVFEENSFLGGGGLFNGGSTTLDNCIFVGNTAYNPDGRSYGGGIYSHFGSLIVTNCVFLNNTATGGDWNYGGGLFSEHAPLTVTNCTFIGNSVSGGGWAYGGGLWAGDPYSIITNCLFSGNNANNSDRALGGGIYCASLSSTITNCIFSGNRASNSIHTNGGALYSWRYSNPPSGYLSITNCLFAENSATDGSFKKGGGLYLNLYGQTDITNCTITKNNTGIYNLISLSDGGGIYTSSGETSVSITNCILWDNFSDINLQISIPEEQSFISYSNIDQEGFEDINGNIREDPLFVDSLNGDFHLDAGSPCIDSGTSNETSTIDLVGNNRYDNPYAVNTGGGVYPYYDMGAYEVVDVFDKDGTPDYSDNCPYTPNGPDQGTCMVGNIGQLCTVNTDCGENGYCSKNQEDSYPPEGNGIGDVCECEADFDCDGDVDGSDATTFKLYFGRNPMFYPCDEINPCRGDFDCDNDCDGTDASLFKTDFGRSEFSNPCHACVVGEWCSY